VKKSLRLYSQISTSEPLLFLSSSFSALLARLSGPVPHPLLLRKSGSVENGTRTSGSVARSSDHWTTEAVYYRRTAIKLFGAEIKFSAHLHQVLTIEGPLDALFVPFPVHRSMPLH
jgi:hypothetical protein